MEPTQSGIGVAATPAAERVVRKCWKPDCPRVAVVRDGAGWWWCHEHIDQEKVGGRLNSAREWLTFDLIRDRAAKLFAEREAAARREEREACAKECDSLVGDSDGSAFEDGISVGRERCAAAIRARGKE